MTTELQHRPDRLVVSFSGEITWPSARRFVDDVDANLEQYFYRHIEVIVSSPGGLIDAFEYMVGAFARWRRVRGVHVHTRVIATAASAGAVLLSLGDERVAEPGAKLLYHFSRALDAGAITADASAELHHKLVRIDECIVGYLVDRALKGRGAAPYQAEASEREVLKRVAEASDREVLKRVAAAITGSADPPKRRSRVKQLAERLGRALDDAVRARDRKTLSRAYRALAQLERPISASLARTLHLIDRIDDADDRPESSPDVQGGLTIPEWRALYPPSGEVPRWVLTRHMLVLGETGSGKSVSVILPLLMALARAPRERLGCALVIDPKRELEPVLTRVAPQRLQHVTPEAIALNVMVGEWSIDADLAAGRWQTAAVRILLRAASFVPSSLLRVLGPHKVSEGNSEFFNQEGAALLRDVLAFILMLTAADAPPPHQWIAKNDEASLQWVSRLRVRAHGHDGKRGPNALALCAWAISESPLASFIPDRKSDDPWLFERLARQAMPEWGAKPGEGRDLLNYVCEYWRSQAEIDRQHAGTLSSARVACAEFASPQVVRSLYFGCEPGWRDAHSCAVDFARLVSRNGDGRFVLYQPKRGTADALVTRALKALFFEAVLADPARVNEGGRMPLVGYVADEFQHFVTSDAVHGEQSFLDTCRSFGAFCVLATQSMSSILHALSEGGGERTTNEMALDMLLINTATKCFFRSTDPNTAHRVEALCPQRPGFSPVTAVRPLSTLVPGECYVALADGRVDRLQLPEVTLDEPPDRRRGSDALTSQDKSEFVDDRGGGHAMDAISVQPMELLSEALASARSIENADRRAQALCAIAEAQAAAGTARGVANTITEALASARSIEDANIRTWALCTIAEAQAAVGDIEGVRASARSIEDGDWRAQALCTIAKAQAAAGDTDGALTSARSIEDAVYLRAQALIAIAGAQAAAGDIEGALATIGIEDGGWHAQALCAIAGAQATAGDIEGALASARSIEDAVYVRAQALCAIAGAQATAGDIEGALASARSIEDAVYVRAQALIAIAGAQAAAGDIEGALASARSIEDADRCAQALIAIAGAQAAAGDIEGALASARSIEDLEPTDLERHYQSANEIEDARAAWRDEALCAIAEAQAAAGDIEGALASARSIEESVYVRAQALIAIAGAQAAAGDIEGALASARSIEDLEPTELERHYQSAHEIKDALATQRAEALRTIAEAQAAAGDIEGALASARSIEESVYSRAEVLIAIAKAQMTPRGPGSM